MNARLSPGMPVSTAGRGAFGSALPYGFSATAGKVGAIIGAVVAFTAVVRSNEPMLDMETGLV